VASSLRPIDGGPPAHQSAQGAEQRRIENAIRQESRQERDAIAGHVRYACLSADFHKYGGIRPAMHPASLRCSSVKYSRSMVQMIGVLVLATFDASIRSMSGC
jgi:hypothetical protein